LSYTKAAGTDPGTSVTLKGDENYDITPYVQKGALHLTATVSGVFPEEAWAVDMTTCLSVKVHYTYL
jgi:hypothetical protein